MTKQGIIRLIDACIEKAKRRFDEYNGIRFTQMKIMVNHGNKLTHAELSDLKVYGAR